MTERRNIDLARRACIARNLNSLRACHASLESLRKSHGVSGRTLKEMERLSSRLLYLETGGDPFDWRWTA